VALRKVSTARLILCPRAGTSAQCPACRIGRVFFSKKGFKKIRKRVPDRKIWKNGYLPPVDRAGGVGPGTSRPSNGREVPKLSADPPEGLFANKKLFLFVKRSLRHPARLLGGRFPPYFCFFYFGLLFLVF
jgi:hypothetical protein